MNLYLDNGYLNFDKIYNMNYIFNFIIGGRGIGKTFGALDHSIKNDSFILFLRRTQIQLDATMNEAFNPFKAISTDIMIQPAAKNTKAIFLNREDEPRQIGLAAALSTFANIRGFDGSKIDTIIFDEFIPESQEAKRFDEAKALFNCYETVNRNRELTGAPAVRVFALANSNMLANDIFMQLDIITPAMKLLESDREIWTDAARNILICMPKQSPISDLKKETALYKLTRGTDFENMAIKNQFMNEDLYNIKPQPIKEYNPLLNVGEIYIYRHKSNGSYYISEHKSGSPKRYEATPSGLRLFQRAIVNTAWPAYIKGNIYYETYIQKILFEKYLNS